METFNRRTGKILRIIAIVVSLCIIHGFVLALTADGANKTFANDSTEKATRKETSALNIVTFPMPAKDNVKITFYHEGNIKIKFAVFTALGNKVDEYNGSISTGQQLIEINTSQWAQGTYIYKLYLDKKMFYGKIVIVK